MVPGVWNQHRRLQLKWFRPPGNSKFLNLETWQEERVLFRGGCKVRSPWKFLFFLGLHYLASFILIFIKFSKKNFFASISGQQLFQSNITDPLILRSQDHGRWLTIGLRLASDGGWNREFNRGHVARPLGSCTGFNIRMLYFQVVVRSA